jgi:meso-butanediol dehydrogenase/(S,S)-butanediol dehydrogenase/diacetyl reductase
MRRFEDKVVLVTGAAGGIGRATALRLSSEGASLLLCDVQDDATSETAAMCREAGVEAKALHCDVGSDEQVDAAVAACVKHFGKLDALINVAGILLFQHTTDLATDVFQRILDINLTGTFRMCRAAIPHLLESGGCVVNTASTAGEMGLPYGQAYSASKGGVIAMTRAMAVEFGARGIRFNGVSPGSIETAMSKPNFPDNINMRLMMRQSSLDKSRGPEVVASVIAMLASEDGCHINGEIVRMDGGALA